MQESNKLQNASLLKYSL